MISMTFALVAASMFSKPRSPALETTLARPESSLITTRIALPTTAGSMCW